MNQELTVKLTYSPHRTQCFLLDKVLKATFKTTFAFGISSDGGTIYLFLKYIF